MESSRTLDKLSCYVTNEEYLIPISRWLNENAYQDHREWKGLFIEGPNDNGYMITIQSEVSQNAFLKCFGVRNQKLYHVPFLSIFSKALHAYRTSCTLFNGGIATAEPLAYVKFKSGPNKGKELLFTRWIEDSVTLGSFFSSFFAQQRDIHWQNRKKKLITQTAKFLRELHSAGIYHRDLNRENILIKEKDDSFDLYLIDTDDVRIAFRVSYKRVIKNIDKINRYILNKSDLSTTDRIRFLKAYLGDKANDRMTIRRYWKDVERETFETLKKRNKEFISKIAYLTIFVENVAPIDSISFFLSVKKFIGM